MNEPAELEQQDQGRSVAGLPTGLRPTEAQSPAGLSDAEAIAFMAGWNARETGSGYRADGRESCLGMFARGFNFGDSDTGEDLSRGSNPSTNPPETNTSAERVNAELIAMERLMIRWRIAAQRWTPGGSEYMDPAYCEAFIAEQRQDHSKTKAENARLRKALASVQP